MQPRAAQSVRLTLSRKRSRAKSAVATISKFPKRDALAASPPRSPSIKRMGAAISSRIIPRVGARSSRPSRGALSRWRRDKRAMPTPAPR